MTKRKITVILSTVAATGIVAAVTKTIWTCVATRNIGSFNTEKKEILARRDYLIEKVIVPPDRLISEMPEAVGPRFRGEWAMYSCSMLSAALVNLSILYPETTERSRSCMDSLITIVLSEPMRRYDTDQ